MLSAIVNVLFLAAYPLWSLIMITLALLSRGGRDGHQGVYVPRDLIPAFFAAHAGLGLVAHNAAFDLKVTQAVLGDRLDLYGLVEEGKVWCTLILNRLLSLATAGHTATGTTRMTRA